MFTTLAPFLLTLLACGLALWSLGRAAELERSLAYWRGMALKRATPPLQTVVARQYHAPRAGIYGAGRDAAARQ